MRIAYFHLMRDERDRVRAVAPDHAAYWRDLRVPGYVGGPLADRSGGLITFEAESMQVADELVANDPFRPSGPARESLGQGVGSGRDRAGRPGPSACGQRARRPMTWAAQPALSPWGGE